MKLLKCPFGCVSERCKNEDDTGYWIECIGCKARGPNCPTLDMAIETWNIQRRAQPDER